jgi:glyoxylase-like metal-dependent hydrolase (beta-lactamase superfamily II)
MVFALAFAALLALSPPTWADGPKSPAVIKAIQTRTPEDPNLVWTASHVVLIAKEVAAGAYAVFPDDAEVKNKAGIPVATSGGFIVGDDAVLVIDTMLNRRLATQLLALIKEKTSKPIRYVVNTSYHGDHSYGNQFFPKGTEIIQHMETQEYIQSHFAEDIEFMKTHFGTNQGLDELKPQRAHILVHDGATLEVDLGGKRVQIMHLGFAQTPGDLFVWLPNEKVLYTGNPIIASPPALPWLLDGRLEDALATMRKLRKLLPENAVVVPGHGYPTDAKSIDYPIAYLEQVKKEVQAAIKQGLSEEETVGAVTMKEYSGYKIFAWVHSQINVSKTYQELKQNK